MPTKSPSDARLYGILDLGYVDPREALATTTAMLEGGVDILQLRWKDGDRERIEELAGQILPQTRDCGVPLIINDYPEIAAETDADGVHIGQEDGSVAEARTIAGGKKMVGRSTHSLAQAEAGAAEGADYIGFGPLFATPTKPGRPAIGLEDIAEVHRRVSIPIFCIGGIKLENLESIVEAGARRVVIVSGILQSGDIASYVRAAKSLLPPD